MGTLDVLGPTASDLIACLGEKILKASEADTVFHDVHISVEFSRTPAREYKAPKITFEVNDRDMRVDGKKASDAPDQAFRCPDK